MKSYLFAEDIKKESVDKLITAINDGAKVIYMRSEGGDVDFIDIMAIELLRANCVLIAFGHLMSAALALFSSYKGRKTIVPGLEVAIHFPTYDVDIRSTLGKSIMGIHDNYELFQKETYSSLCDEWEVKFTGLGISEDILNHLKDGKTIYLNWDKVSRLNFGPSYSLYDDFFSQGKVEETTNEGFMECFNGLLHLRDKAIEGVSYEEITRLLTKHSENIRNKYIN